MLKRLGFLLAFTMVASMVTGCTVKLVAPYDADLQLKASSMQAEVDAWDLTMRNGAGTIADDPRHPDVVAMITKWHDEAGAMLTIAASNDTVTANCSEAEKAVYGVIENDIPANLRASAQANTNAKSTSGCDASLVALIDKNIDDVEKSLTTHCQASWIPDTYFTTLAQNKATAPPPPNAPDSATQNKLNNACLAEFKIVPGLPAGSAGAQHGRAVSSLLTTLKSIVYVETRKKVAAVPK